MEEKSPQSLVSQKNKERLPDLIKYLETALEGLYNGWSRESLTESLNVFFPDRAEDINLFFDMQEYVQKQIEYTNISGREKNNMFGDERMEYRLYFSNFMLRLINYILKNNQNKDFLGSFWNTWEKFIEKEKDKRAIFVFNDTRRGVLAQVAAFRIFSILGKSPVLSSPRDDVFLGIDIYATNELMIQVKSWWSNISAIISSDFFISPFFENDQEKHLAEEELERFTESIDSFRRNMQRLKKSRARKISGGLIFFIPNSRIDRATGEPDKNMVKFFREKLIGSFLPE